MISLSTVNYWNEERLWTGIHSNIRRWIVKQNELRRSDVVVSYTRSGDSSKLVLPRLNTEEIKGLLFLSRYLYEYYPDLAPFGLGIIEAVKEMISKRFQFEKRELEDSLIDFLNEIQIFFDFNGNGYKSQISDTFGNYDPKVQNQGIFFGNQLEPAKRKILQIQYVENTKVKKPQRRKGYNDKGSTRPLHAWKPSSDFSMTDDQNYTIRRRIELMQEYHFRFGLLGLDYNKVQCQLRGRSIDSLFANLNFKNPERNDDYYVNRKQKYPRTKKQQHCGGSNFTPYFRAGTLAEAIDEAGKLRNEHQPAKKPNCKPGPPNRDSQEVSTVIKTGQNSSSCKTAHSPFSQQIEANWNKKYIKDDLLVSLFGYHSSDEE